jgi:hypothetical protein
MLEIHRERDYDNRGMKKKGSFSASSVVVLCDLCGHKLLTAESAE